MPRLLSWEELMLTYFDEIESRLKRAVDREAILATASCVDVCFTLRHWIPAFGISFAKGSPRILFGHPLGWFFSHLTRFDSLLDHMLGRAIERAVRFATDRGFVSSAPSSTPAVL